MPDTRDKGSTPDDHEESDAEATNNAITLRKMTGSGRRSWWEFRYYCSLLSYISGKLLMASGVNSIRASTGDS